MRRFRTVPIGPKPVWLELAIQKVLCLACGVLRQVKVRGARQQGQGQGRRLAAHQARAAKGRLGPGVGQSPQGRGSHRLRLSFNQAGTYPQGC